MAWTTPASATPGQLVTAAWLNQYIRDNMNAMFPVGFLMYRVADYSSVETAVEGRWLQCNGVAVSRTTYAVLFTHLNSLSPALPFGVGNGSTTFNLPDLRGRAPWGEGNVAKGAGLGNSDGLAVVNRSPDHWHQVVEGGAGTGFGAPVASAGDASQLAATTAGSPDGPKDHPSYLVAGSWFIKYTS